MSEFAVRIFEDAEAGRTFILSRRSLGSAELSPGMRAGVREMFGEDLTGEEVVRRILQDVRERGDGALFDYTQRIDRVELTSIEVTADEFEQAEQQVERDVRDALALAAERIRAFHEHQNIESWTHFDEDGALGQMIRPLERVGVYAPGGTAPYPSSLLMTAIPAKVAGVGEVIVCAPPERGGNIAPVTLVAARIAGVDRVFKLGGAQAIGAMAYGSETVPKVDKILGPGNIFVVLAKRAVYGEVDIDSLPGPTETLVIADQSADPKLCAADLLAQAEHDPMASAILITTSRELLGQVRTALGHQLGRLSRSAVAAASLAENGALILAPSMDDALDIANAYAPEHLCLLTEQPWDLVGRVRHAGGVFLGEHSPEVLGDYTAGPSHVMPTGQTARFSSPVNLFDFVKVISVIGLNRTAMAKIGPAAATIAYAEGLTAHAAAIERRLERLHPD